MQFGVSGSGIAFNAMNEESKSTAVGRRDIFSMPLSGNTDKPPMGK